MIHIPVYLAEGREHGGRGFGVVRNPKNSPEPGFRQENSRRVMMLRRLVR